MARPSTFSQQTADKILDRISEGEMLIKICREDDMPERKTVYTWMTSHPEFRDAYARARLSWADWWAEKVLTLSLDSSGDIFIDETGKAVVDHANVQRARLQCDNIKWLVGKYAPRTYGDKPELPAIGSGGDITRIERIIVSWDDKRAQEPAKPPALITYDPGPLPARLAPEIMQRFWRVVKDVVPHADQRDPDEVMTQVIDVCERALKAEFQIPADAVSA